MTVTCSLPQTLNFRKNDKKIRLWLCYLTKFIYSNYNFEIELVKGTASVENIVTNVIKLCIFPQAFEYCAPQTLVKISFFQVFCIKNEE